MALGSVCRVWIVWVLLSGTLSLGCERLQLLQDLNTDTLGKLNEMARRHRSDTFRRSLIFHFPGRPLSWHCVREKVRLKTRPLKLVNLANGLSALEKIQIVLQTLRQTSEFYSEDSGSAPWPREEVEIFRLLLHRQIREPEECAWKRAPESQQKRNIAVHKYFRKLRRFRKHQNFGDCAWEMIRAETRAHLQQILLIMANTRS
ncbi:interferon alpha-4-like [Amblyraja radiata]|uniref:interferon alpha-4-like n=1 Tax=Amblyraja radiata TaxID=386614 RepID=UPI001402BA7F|nr:interferon alpha-4-like [Amblyraja radiata]